MLAGGAVENNRARLQAWGVDAPSLKPGTKMPRMNQFDGSELNALVAYLETLK